jgi:hypothetical protein
MLPAQRIRLSIWCELPSLLVFAPCEKIIIDQDNNPSLIAILQEISLDSRVASKAPGGALAALPWQIFALWARSPDDDAATIYEQACDLLLPDGQVVVPSRTTFQIEGPSHRNITKVIGFPVFATPGEGQLRLYLRTVDEEAAEPRLIASFPLRLKHHASEK